MLNFSTNNFGVSPFDNPQDLSNLTDLWDDVEWRSEFSNDIIHDNEEDVFIQTVLELIKENNGSKLFGNNVWEDLPLEFTLSVLNNTDIKQILEDRGEYERFIENLITESSTNKLIELVNSPYLPDHLILTMLEALSSRGDIDTVLEENNIESEALFNNDNIIDKLLNDPEFAANNLEFLIKYGLLDQLLSDPTFVANNIQALMEGGLLNKLPKERIMALLQNENFINALPSEYLLAFLDKLQGENGASFEKILMLPSLDIIMQKLYDEGMLNEFIYNLPKEAQGPILKKLGELNMLDQVSDDLIEDNFLALLSSGGAFVPDMIQRLASIGALDRIISNISDPSQMAKIASSPFISQILENLEPSTILHMMKTLAKSDETKGLIRNILSQLSDKQLKDVLSLIDDGNKDKGDISKADAQKRIEEHFKL